MCPRQSLQGKAVVNHRQKVQGLIDKKHMPPLDDVLGAEKLDNSHNDLRRYNGDARGQRDPSNRIDTPTKVTLEEHLAHRGSHFGVEYQFSFDPFWC